MSKEATWSDSYILQNLLDKTVASNGLECRQHGCGNSGALEDRHISSVEGWLE